MEMHMKACSRTKRRMEQHRFKPKNGMHKDCSKTTKKIKNSKAIENWKLLVKAS
jgi:hypothetical protein